MITFVVGMILLGAGNPGDDRGIDSLPNSTAPRVAPGIPATPSPRSDIDFFETAIRPVLIEHCYECHSRDAERVRSDLLLDSRAGVLRGGDRGPAIVRGDADASLLLRALRHDDPDLRMPPSGRLPERVIRDFERWILAGAPDPRTEPEPVEPSGTRGRDADGLRRPDPLESPRWRWLSKPPVRPRVPEVRDSVWPARPIDRFILARLESDGLQPVANASPRALVRRLWLTLAGLPPPSEAVAAFARDPSPRRYEELVDRLLASPRFGERFGRHWLDVARYGESAGGGRSILFEEAWRYRDWVIRAFNEDLPFSRFVRAQIAGDLLESTEDSERRDGIVATGFLALGPKNLDNQDKELLRMDVVDEQLDTLGRAFLGLSIGCARCHDHKFDPIPTRDYYALAGILRSTKTMIPGNVSGYVRSELPVSDSLRAKHNAWRTALETAKAELANEKSALAKAESALSAVAAERFGAGGIIVDDHDAELVGDWTPSTYTKGFYGERYVHDGDAAKGTKLARFIPELPSPGEYEVRVSYTTGSNRATNVPVRIVHAASGSGLEESSVVLDQRRAPAASGAFVAVGRFSFPAGRHGSVTISNAGTDGHVIADAVAFVPLDSSLAAGAEGDAEAARGEARSATLREAVELARARVKEREEKVNSLEREKVELPRAIAVTDEAAIEDAPIHIRGLVRNYGEVVPRGFLSALGVDGAPLPSGSSTSGRLELAHWIASSENPLAARVFVNRVWLWVFGEGIVPTPDDFGTSGRPASHPELLDWLAREFIEAGGSTKALVRSLVLSRTFRLSSDRDPQALEKDPEARLLWRLPRLRLDAEALRDSMLSVSRELDLAMGGPTIAGGSESEFDYVFDRAGDRLRRSVYLPVLRNARPPIFAVFDFPNPNLVTGRRTRSTLPSQSLYWLNSDFVLDRARAAAGALLGRPDLTTDGERAIAAFELALGRPPFPGELRAALDSLPQSASAADRLDVWAGLFQALFGSIDFRYRE